MTEASPLAAQPFDPLNAAASGRAAAALRGTSPAHLLFVLAEAESADWPVRAAMALADALAAAEDRAVLLADLGFDEPLLGAVLGGVAAPGVADMLLYGASPRHVGVRASGHAFVVIPPGTAGTGGGELMHHPGWRAITNLLDRDRTRLIACVPASVDGLGALLRVTSVVLLGSAESVARWRARWPAAAVRLALVPEAAAPVPAASPPDAAVGAVSEQAGSAGPAGAAHAASGPPAGAASRPAAVAPRTRAAELARRRRLALGGLLAAVVVVAVVGGLWQFRRGAAGAAPESADSAAVPSSAEAPGAPGAIDSSTSLVSADEPRPEGVLLPYSVAVEAHETLTTAVRRIAALRAARPGTGFYIAPILVDSSLYYRLMAGPLRDSVTAASVMRELIASGHKTGGSEWDIRSTPYAFLLGAYATPEEAAARSDEAAVLDIPAYVVEVPYTGGTVRYRVYAGAYASTAEAELMRRLLQGAALPDTLVQRIGRSPS